MKRRYKEAGRTASVVGNPDVVAFALYQLGGTGRFVEIEDLFMRCYELAPRRFGWRTQAYPNYKTLYQALVDLERSHPNSVLKTANGFGRQLTAEGVAWVRSRERLLERALAQPAGGMAGRRPSQRLLNEFIASTAMQQFLKGAMPELSRYQAADLLIASPDSPPSVWRERLQTYRSAAEAAGRSEVKEFLNRLEASHREWFTGGDQ